MVLGKITLLILFLVVALGVFNLYQNNRAHNDAELESVIIEKPVSEKQENYSSKNLKFKIHIPEGMSVDEKFTNVLLTSPLGEIRISRIGTNFDSIDSYMQNLEVKNKTVYETKEFGKIGGHDVVYVTFVDPSENSRQFSEIMMFVNGWIYKFSTINDPLRPILKDIAQSFKYEP